jgi:hypothetical protein
MEAEQSLIEQYEFVKEIHFVFDNIKPKIKARIYKVIKGLNAKYLWDINFYCRLAGEAQVYIPGSPYGDTLEETEYKLSLYVKRFERSVELKANDFF